MRTADPVRVERNRDVAQLSPLSIFKSEKPEQNSAELFPIWPWHHSRIRAIHSRKRRFLMKTVLTILLLATCSLAQSSSLALPTVAQLVGSWRLVSVEVTMKGGTVKPDDRFGPHARGYIMYEPDGHMCAEIMNP